MAARLVERRREIGLLGAVGFTPRQVSSALLLEHLTLGLVAALAGWFLAGFLAPKLQLGIGAALGPQGPAWTLLGLVVTALVISVILTLATLVPAHRAARRPVTDVLRDAPSERASRLTRRLAGVPRRLSMLGVRDVASRPGRAALTALAIAVAVVGAVVSFGFIGAVDTARADTARVGDPWDVTVVNTGVPAAQLEAALAGRSQRRRLVQRAVASQHVPRRRLQLDRASAATPTTPASGSPAVARCGRPARRSPATAS